MSRLSFALIAVAAVCSALPAQAQTRPQPQPSASGRVFDTTPYRPLQYGERIGYEMDLAAASGNNIPAQPLERIDLANRVSTLIELGRCTEARAMAREAGETQMALRARQMCRADKVS